MSNLTRWNPVRDLINLRESMDQFFNDRMSRGFDFFGHTMIMPIDVYSTDDAIVLVADVPGLKPEDLSITLEGDTLTIRGELKPAAEQRNYLIRERMSGKFERTLTISTPINNEKVEANFDNGVLTLTMPKADAAKPKQITIKAGNGHK